jgi:hypothetical protein
MVFERGNRTDIGHKEGLACELVLANGRTLVGFAVGLAGKSLSDLLNGVGGFIEFEGLDRNRSFIAKNAVESVRLLDVAKVEPLHRRVRAGEAFDPLAVLGLEAGADREAIRRAYHALARAYHPDRLQGLGLPSEILEYATAMAKRINAAYSMLSGGGRIDAA